MEYKNEIIPIKGMHCSKCVSTIERTLMEIDGVEKANVSLSEKQANVLYDASKISMDDFNRELRSVGYEIGHDYSLLDKIKGLFKKILSLKCQKNCKEKNKMGCCEGKKKKKK